MYQETEYMTRDEQVLTIRYIICPPDPSVGINLNYVGEWYVTHINYEPISSNDKEALAFYKALHDSGEDDYIEEALLDE